MEGHSTFLRLVDKLRLAWCPSEQREEAESLESVAATEISRTTQDAPQSKQWEGVCKLKYEAGRGE